LFDGIIKGLPNFRLFIYC